MVELFKITPPTYVVVDNLQEARELLTTFAFLYREYQQYIVSHDGNREWFDSLTFKGCEYSDLYASAFRVVENISRLEWALTYESTTPIIGERKDSDEEFVNKYLVPGGDTSDAQFKEFYKNYFVEKAEISNEVKALISSISYKEFLQTPYWIFIARIKKGQIERCQLCNSDKKLEVHHSTYDIRGNEINHLDKLTVLCHDCHAKYHDKVKDGRMDKNIPKD